MRPDGAVGKGDLHIRSTSSSRSALPKRFRSRRGVVGERCAPLLLGRRRRRAAPACETPPAAQMLGDEPPVGGRQRRIGVGELQTRAPPPAGPSLGDLGAGEKRGRGGIERVVGGVPDALPPAPPAAQPGTRRLPATAATSVAIPSVRFTPAMIALIRSHSAPMSAPSKGDAAVPDARTRAPSAPGSAPRRGRRGRRTAARRRGCRGESG